MTKGNIDHTWKSPNISSCLEFLGYGVSIVSTFKTKKQRKNDHYRYAVKFLLKYLYLLTASKSHSEKDKTDRGELYTQHTVRWLFHRWKTFFSRNYLWPAMIWIPFPSLNQFSSIYFCEWVIKDKWYENGRTNPASVSVPLWRHRSMRSWHGQILCSHVDSQHKGTVTTQSSDDLFVVSFDKLLNKQSSDQMRYINGLMASR